MIYSRQKQYIMENASQIVCDMSGIIFVTNGNGEGVVYMRQGDVAINCLSSFGKVAR